VTLTVLSDALKWQNWIWLCTFSTYACIQRSVIHPWWSPSNAIHTSQVLAYVWALCACFLAGAAPRSLQSRSSMDLHNQSASTNFDHSLSMDLGFSRAVSAGRPDHQSRGGRTASKKDIDIVFTRAISAGPLSTRRRLSGGQPHRVELPSEQFTRHPSQSTSPRSHTLKKSFSSGTAFYSRIVAQQSQKQYAASLSRWW